MAKCWTEKARLSTDRGPMVICDFSPRVNLQCRLYLYKPRAQITCINICSHVKCPKHWQPYRSLDMKILHALEGMVSTAIMAAATIPSQGAPNLQQGIIRY